MFFLKTSKPASPPFVWYLNGIAISIQVGQTKTICNCFFLQNLQIIFLIQNYYPPNSTPIPIWNMKKHSIWYSRTPLRSIFHGKITQSLRRCSPYILKAKKIAVSDFHSKIFCGKKKRKFSDKILKKNCMNLLFLTKRKVWK